MWTQTRLIKMTCLAILLGIAAPVWAQAPVYEADSLPDQEMATDQTDYPVPPPPIAANQQEGETFVPMQPQQQPAIVAAGPRTGSLENRLQRIEQQVGSMQTGGAAARVDSLQDQVQSLRNQVEMLSHQLEQLQTQQKNQYADLDKRLTQTAVAPAKPTEVATATEPATVPAPVIIKHKKAGKGGKQTEIVSSDNLANLNEKSVAGTGQPNVQEEQQIYQTAYNLIKSKKYDEAVKALQGMLKRYPSGQFASNAHYWLGELFGLMGKNDQALKEFNAVVQQFPDSPRVSDAQLKVGLILASEFKWTDAKSAFKKVVSHYPGSASARLAMEQLKQIKQAGH